MKSKMVFFLCSRARQVRQEPAPGFADSENRDDLGDAWCLDGKAQAKPNARRRGSILKT